MSKHGRFEKPKVKKPLGGKKIALIVVGVILVLLIAAVIFGIVYYNSILNKMKHVDVPKIQYTEATTEATEETAAEATTAVTTEETTVETTEPHVASSADYINFLIVGQASRGGEEERFADTMILCTGNTYEKTLTMTSMLRDTLVQQSGSYGTHTWGGI